ncbi:MAG TPA: CpaD family pilus assembly lipoprotein [Allosphingosinicella sp.]|uniref:CpaD family pilus assembly protein n=1 Tax=Allosphingosinicella sp. TaxID=2823234 RepID=UPI002ED83EB5
MAHPIFSLALLGIGSALAGCAELTPELAAKHNPGVYSVHQPVVQRHDYAIDLATGSGGLASGEAARLHSWFQSLGLGYGDRVTLDDESGYGADARADVARITENYGLLLSEGSPITAGAVQPGAIRVIVSRASAAVPSCPDWSYAQLSGAPVSTDSNYGCAYNKNLAAMVADPTDLVLGQAGSGTDPNAAAKPVRALRNRAGTGAGGTVAAPGVN